MATQLDQLKQLQVIDGELYRLRRQQEEKPRELERVHAQMAAQDAAVKAADERLKSVQMAQKEKDGELQSREANVRKLQSQLFQLKTNKEYTAMQREIEALKADNSLLEEAILKLFDAIELAANDRQREQTKLAEDQARLQASRARIEQELAALGDKIGQLERDRHTILPGVPPDTLATYERALKIRDGLALVPIMNDSCGGCHRRLPPQVVNQVLLNASVVTCEICNRILYFDDAHSKL